MLGTDPAQDAVIYEQEDESFYTAVGTTKDERYICHRFESTVSTEYRYARADDPALAFRVFLPRERDHEYHVEHLDGRWIIRTNWQAQNFRLMEATVGEEGDRAKWRESCRTATTPSSTISTCSRTSSRSRSARARCARSASGRWAAARTSSSRRTSRPTPRASARIAELDTRIVRYEYTSLTTPATVYDYDIQTGERRLMKRTPVLGDFDPANYRTELVWAQARDGEKMPVSLVYRDGFKQRRHRADAAVRLRLLWRDHGPGVLDLAAVAARPRLRVRARARARRPGDGPALVRRRQAAQQAQHLQRLHRRHAVPGEGGVCRPEARLGDGRQRRRPADGRHRQPGAGRLPRDRRAGAVRGRRHDHARREHPAHHQRVRRVGQPEEEGVLRLHAVVLAL